MEDEAGMDEKDYRRSRGRLAPYYTDVHSFRQLPQVLLDQIAHFFTHYKDLEEGKWARIVRWAEAREAEQLIVDGHNNGQSGNRGDRQKSQATEGYKERRGEAASDAGRYRPCPYAGRFRRSRRRSGSNVGPRRGGVRRKTRAGGDGDSQGDGDGEINHSRYAGLSKKDRKPTRVFANWVMVVEARSRVPYR